MALWMGERMRNVVAGFAVTAALGSGLAGSQVRHVKVLVDSPDGNRAVEVWTFKQRVKNILTGAHVRVGAHDYLSTGLNRVLTGSSITIRRALPVIIKTAHRHFDVWTTHYRVQSVLNALSIQLHSLDQVKPGLKQTVQSGMTITVIRRWHVIKKVVTQLPFSKVYQANSQMTKGQQRVVQSGHLGKEQTTIQYLMQNGRAIRHKVLKRQIQTKPVNEVISYGTKHPVVRAAATPQAHAASHFVRTLDMVSTGYWPNPSWSNGYTAMGTKAGYGVVAVDPAVIPLGTRLYIPGYGFATAEDTGSAIVGNRIDLCFNSQQQAVNWGVKPITVYVVG